MNMDEKIVLQKDFDQYIREIIEISALSNKENSVMYEFEFRNEFIMNKISILDNKSGNMEVLKEGVFTHNDHFMSHFLSPLIYQFVENNSIVSHDVIDLNNDNLLTYRFLTDTNDLLSINRLSFEETSYISDLVEGLDMNPQEDGNLFTVSKNVHASGWIILFLIIAICLILFFVSQFM